MDAEQIFAGRLPGMTHHERALSERSEHYRSMFTYHPLAAYSVDLNGYYTAANAPALAMTGLSLEAMVETHFADVIHPEDLHVVQAAFDRALGRAPQQVEARVVRADGEVLEIRCTVIPIIVAGEVVGVHGITEDITEANRLVRELEEANCAKATFLANVSHEVRTPLSSIVGATELLMDAELAPESERLVRMLHRASERLSHLIDDILDFSRLAADHLALRPRPFSVAAVVREVAEWSVPLAESRGLDTSFEVDQAVPATAVGDGGRVHQVLTHLVQNAIKFTESGGVEVRAGLASAAPGAHDATRGGATWVELAVTDTGIGIPEERLHTLFEPFTQVDPSATRSYAGVGLGLAICRDLVALMGGQLEATTAVGEGTTFTVLLPLVPVGDGVTLDQEPPWPRDVVSAPVTGS